ncbi:hypothetical protein KP79_PYT26260 [Mizuhopecten yessoensis]|uniref:Tesmin/TSO1-like CXC domain-containing protein n=1 Tax=Mizuhopecten yessoensis TaxID=6573 RepID=A0A210QBU2_MIZYE|nr:hypothetical protein KP79_PYT26260 [Mizuhopecten yessoensis]
MRRSKGIVSPNVNFAENMPFKSKKEAFLGNPVNKQKFIDMLSSKLSESGVRCLKAVDDADLLIAQSAVNFSKEQKTAVIGEDTDLLVLLCHHADPNQYPIIFKSDKQVGRKLKIWDISKTIKSLGEDICNLLPFIHAITGCDTTSRLFGIGKNIGLKKCKENAYFMEQGKTFIHSSSSKDEVIKAGAECIVQMYGGLQHEGLDILRWRKFTSKVVSGHVGVQIKTLPPTSDAAKYHSLRTYLQCQQWINNGQNLDPTEWGWYIQNGKLFPVKSSIAPAPEQLMKMIKCNCKLNCDTKRCTCRRNGLECSAACGECRGINCTNSNPVTAEDLGED